MVKITTTNALQKNSEKELPIKGNVNTMEQNVDWQAKQVFIHSKIQTIFVVWENHQVFLGQGHGTGFARANLVLGVLHVLQSKKML
jgi:hypothetical protein